MFRDHLALAMTFRTGLGHTEKSIGHDYLALSATSRTRFHRAGGFSAGAVTFFAMLITGEFDFFLHAVIGFFQAQFHFILNIMATGASAAATGPASYIKLGTEHTA